MSEIVPRPFCRHCGRSFVCRPRGLCWACYHIPGVRELYPSTSKYAARGVRDFNGKAKLPDDPTPALPGTEEKVQALEERAAKGTALWHPADARLNLR